MNPQSLNDCIDKNINISFIFSATCGMNKSSTRIFNRRIQVQMTTILASMDSSGQRKRWLMVSMAGNLLSTVYTNVANKCSGVATVERVEQPLQGGMAELFWPDKSSILVKHSYNSVTEVIFGSVFICSNIK